MRAGALFEGEEGLSGLTARSVRLIVDLRDKTLQILDL